MKLSFNINFEWLGRTLFFFLKLLVYIALVVLGYASFLWIMKEISSELAETILNYIKVLAWPFLVLLIVLAFRPNIAQLITRLEEFDIPMLGKGKATPLIQQESYPPQPDRSLPQPEYDALLKEKEKEIEGLKDNTQKLIEKLTVAEIELDFERIYNFIFSNQIDLLLKINNYPQVDFSFIENHFSNMQKLYPVFVDKGWSVNEYLVYLHNSGLLSLAGGKYLVSQKGKAFLSYLGRKNYKKIGM